MAVEAERVRSGATSIVVSDLGVVDRMLGFGAESLRRCYQCGTCSVVCPRTPLEEAFPRKEMVWAQWGLEDKLLADVDAWLCYQCNDCITYCPVDARPGDVMAATRDLQMAEYAVPRFMGRIPSDRRYLPIAVAIPGVLVGLLVVAATLLSKGEFTLPKGKVLFEHYIGHGWVDVFTLSLLVVVAVLSFSGLRRFWAALGRSVPAGTERLPLSRAVRGAVGDAFSHQGFDDCTTSHVRLWAHLAIFYGFLGLVAATTGAALYTEIFPLLGIHWHGNQLSLPLWDPVKIVGNVGGVALLVALGQTLWMRFTRRKTAGKSTYSDWFFSGLLGLTALTGFATEILRFADARTGAYVAYTVHLVFIFGLFAYFPFSKFSHAMYRTAALAFARQIGRAKPAPAVAAGVSPSTGPPGTAGGAP
jgi:quinone-modifying oxidoreductase, subunit QmoC